MAAPLKLATQKQSQEAILLGGNAFFFPPTEIDTADCVDVLRVFVTFLCFYSLPVNLWPGKTCLLESQVKMSHSD